MIVLLAAALASTPVATWDLQQDDGGLTSTGELGQWSWGVVANGPGSGYDGTRAWAIGLDGAYLNDSVEYLNVPLPDLTATAAPVLRFEQWYGFGAGDYGYVEVDSGLGYRGVAPVYGYPSALGWTGSSGGWADTSVELTPSAVRLRFVFVSDTAGIGAGWFLDAVGVWDGDVTAPRVVALDELPDTEDLTGPYVVGATVDDDTRVASATLLWSTSRGDSSSAPMIELGEGQWQAELPGQAPDTVVTYRLLASDGANSTTWPTTGGRSFRVYLPAPTDLTGPAGRVVATEATLSWTPPSSAHTVLGYRVYRAETELLTETADPTATIELTGEDEFTVRAEYAEGLGDASAPFTVDATVPFLLGIEPSSGYAGDTLRVELLGDHAQFVDGEVELDLGAGITTTAVAVRDVDRLLADVVIEESAGSGDRTVVLTSPVGTLSLPGAFTVRDAEARPHLTELSPSTVTQGATGTLLVSFTGSLATTPAVDLGEGIVVESVTVEGDQLLVDYAVAITAPVGEHAVTADDGVRRLDGVNLTIRDWTPGPVQSCDTGGGAPAALAVVLAALTLVRRRIAAG